MSLNDLLSRCHYSYNCDSLLKTPLNYFQYLCIHSDRTKLPPSLCTRAQKRTIKSYRGSQFPIGIPAAAALEKATRASNWPSINVMSGEKGDVRAHRRAQKTNCLFRARETGCCVCAHRKPNLICECI